MTKALLGIDGGGTKTHAVIVDLDGHILGTAANGGANWERIGLQAVQTGLQELIRCKQWDWIWVKLAVLGNL